MGVNVQNLYGKDYNGRKLGNALILGFHAGANIQVRITQGFYFQPGLMFITKGKGKYNNIVRITTNISYIEIPMNFVYKTQLGNGFIMFGIGPYVGYAIMGMEKTKVDGEDSQKQDIEFRNFVEAEDPRNVLYYKALDAGGNVFFGGELEGIFVQLNIQVGMININSNFKGLADDKSEVKNVGFGLSVGYRF
jgi:hypothetical protein